MLTFKSNLREYLARKVFKVKVRFYIIKKPEFECSMDTVSLKAYAFLCYSPGNLCKSRWGARRGLVGRIIVL